MGLWEGGWDITCTSGRTSRVRGPRRRPGAAPRRDETSSAASRSARDRRVAHRPRRRQGANGATFVGRIALVPSRRTDSDAIKLRTRSRAGSSTLVRWLKASKAANELGASCNGLSSAPCRNCVTPTDIVRITRTTSSESC
eukprot:1194658-Prorocentrum_minimum.AAC.2